MSSYFVNTSQPVIFLPPGYRSPGTMSCNGPNCGVLLSLVPSPGKVRPMFWEWDDNPNLALPYCPPCFENLREWWWEQKKKERGLALKLVESRVRQGFSQRDIDAAAYFHGVEQRRKMY